LLGGRLIITDNGEDVQLQTDRLPLPLDRLADGVAVDEGVRRVGLESETALPVRPQPETLTVLGGQPDLVQELVGLRHIQGGPLGAPLLPREVHAFVVTARRAGNAGTEEE